jgi:hypothetical protein
MALLVCEGLAVVVCELDAAAVLVLYLFYYVASFFQGDEVLA